MLLRLLSLHLCNEYPSLPKKKKKKKLGTFCMLTPDYQERLKPFNCFLGDLCMFFS